MPVRFSPRFLVDEDTVTVINDELDGDVLGVHVCHLALKARVTHDGWSKHDSQVLGRHLSDVSKSERTTTDGQKLTRLSPSC